MNFLFAKGPEFDGKSDLRIHTKRGLMSGVTIYEKLDSIVSDQETWSNTIIDRVRAVVYNFL